MHKPEERKDVGLFAQDDPQNEILVSIQSGPKEYHFLQNNALEEVKETSKCKGIKKNRWFEHKHKDRSNSPYR